ncbi:MAG: hypothetical protein HRU69_08580 [Flammeovirgaceae bacterium]|nr:MAG: hypothetical protein HRU69_08580 [Flammeovirgaceae bacterium]
MDITIMRKLWVFVLLSAFTACQENENALSNLTGNEVTYALQAGSVYPVSGSVTIKERKDGAAQIVVTLSGTEGNLLHPVHLHLGDIATPDAEIAALLNPVKGNTGTSETTLEMLADETPITYEALIALNACIKVHLADSGPDRDIILAGGNIGSAHINDSGRSRIEFGVCKSE